MNLKEMVVQTDKGTEYLRNSRDLTKQSPFEGMINDAKARLVSRILRMRIPPRHCTYQSEVERANGIIEYELLARACRRTGNRTLENKIRAGRKDDLEISVAAHKAVYLAGENLPIHRVRQEA